jgi:2'-5' RNA ligase
MNVHTKPFGGAPTTSDWLLRLAFRATRQPADFLACHSGAHRSSEGCRSTKGSTAVTERYLFLALVPAAVRSALEAFLERHALRRRLDSALFAPTNWHQSLSDRFWTPSSEVISALHSAGTRIAAQAVTLRFNRLSSTGQGPIHWAFRARGEPKGFVALVDEVRDALVAVGLPGGGHHKPHVTVSYDAPGVLPTVTLPHPVDWLIDEVALVRSAGQGASYHYVVKRTWKLQAPPSKPQLELF